jgi:hypothetical protein
MAEMQNCKTTFFLCVTAVNLSSCLDLMEGQKEYQLWWRMGYKNT